MRLDREVPGSIDDLYRAQLDELSMVYSEDVLFTCVILSKAEHTFVRFYFLGRSLHENSLARMSHG
jgi:hypothetical protein